MMTEMPTLMAGTMPTLMTGTMRVTYKTRTAPAMRSGAVATCTEDRHQ
jgi:hypothetical protein